MIMLICHWNPLNFSIKLLSGSFPQISAVLWKYFSFWWPVINQRAPKKSLKFRRIFFPNGRSPIICRKDVCFAIWFLGAYSSWASWPLVFSSLWTNELYPWNVYRSSSRHVFTNFPNTNLQFSSTKYYQISYNICLYFLKWSKLWEQMPFFDK